VAVLLAALFFGLKDIHKKNEAIYNKRAILSAIANHLNEDLNTMSDEQVQAVFDSQIEQLALGMEGKILESEQIKESGYAGGRAEDIDMGKEKKKALDNQILPVFIFTKSDGQKYYIFSVRGKGLWDEIWGNIALESDLNTIAGVAFDHKGETPGLGAEIKDNPAWKSQFVGKQLFDEFGRFVGVNVRKGGARDPLHEVDAISGATITGDGVAEMLERGLQYYEPYINSL
jgi:Na+-transporting NADH:ubiquinone oxidoreductase subunit C